MKSVTSVFAASVIALAFAAPVMANTVTSQQAGCFAVSDQHLFSVTANTVTSCLFAGGGNINGSSSAADVSMIGLGYTFLGDATADVGPNSGDFSIDASLYEDYDQIAIGFKSGVNLVIDYAIFLFDTGTLGGTFSITPTQGGGLSHAIMWGIGDGTSSTSSTSSTSVPEPGSSALALLGLGLLGVGFYTRRKAK